MACPRPAMMNPTHGGTCLAATSALTFYNCSTCQDNSDTRARSRGGRAVRSAPKGPQQPAVYVSRQVPSLPQLPLFVSPIQ